MHLPRVHALCKPIFRRRRPALARAFGALLAATLATPVAVAQQRAPPLLNAHGARDGNVPAWTITAPAPTGWTADCCLYARAIGVNAVMYRGEWTGKPQRVMVLNVWPRKLPDLAAEVAADRARYRQLDPAGKTASFPVRHRAMPCTAAVYQGSDRIDDVLVFCDPGAASGIRLSWSMTVDSNDGEQRALLKRFMQVVVATRYQRNK
ncbi:MAG: hypothetical protein ABI300_07975 [Rhodanobacter sp.]